MPGNLIYYALVLIVIALVAALLGFGGVAGTAMSGAHLLIWLAVVIVDRRRRVCPHSSSLARRNTRRWPHKPACPARRGRTYVA